MEYEFVAVLAAACFASICVYVMVVEHPARLACEPYAALCHFRPSYRRAAIVQIVLAVVGICSAVVAWLALHELGLLLGALALGLVIPFTLIVIMPTNRLLLDPSRGPSAGDTRALMERWARLHLGRTIISVVALAILVACMGRSL